MNRFKGNVVIVTGAGSGIGAGTACAFERVLPWQKSAFGLAMLSSVVLQGNRALILGKACEEQLEGPFVPAAELAFAADAPF